MSLRLMLPGRDWWSSHLRIYLAVVCAAVAGFFFLAAWSAQRADGAATGLALTGAVIAACAVVLNLILLLPARWGPAASAIRSPRPR